MQLRRLEVEGGFLNGLDLTFADGLNVLIGARGSGKTSVIEVLRYCLGVRAVTDKAQKRATDHALWVLGDGSATLTVDLDGVERVIRRGVGQETEAAVPTRGVLFVSQKEIEAIGLDGDSRRRILDDFGEASEPLQEEERLAGEVQAAAQQLHDLRSELDDVVEQLGQLAEVPEQLKQAESEQASTKSESAELSKLQATASKLSESIGELAELADSFETAAERANAWTDDLSAARNDEPDLSRLPDETATEAKEVVTSVRRAIDKALGELAELVEALDAKQEDAEKRLHAKRRELADLNSQIETLEEGAGRISRTLSALREQDTRRKFLSERQAELELKVTNASEARTNALDALAATTNHRYEARESSAQELNDKFEGELRVDVIKAGEVADYESALERALQGSNLKRRDLARQIAERMSPRELIKAVESLDADAVVKAGAISENRARRLVSHLASADTTEIVLANIEEDVQFSLLDGQDFKETDRLSLGQRCTVVLPLLLAQDPDLAVLDQPEDHLDNAFIVDTVVDVLRSRRKGSQRLIATHNANIPVLGEADKVVVLDSSGRQAFVADEGALDDVQVVSAITRLMEGGAEAFRRRADFYGA